MFHYNICTVADDDIFKKQCNALETHIPNIKKGDFLEDVDGSVTQIYNFGDNKISVHKSNYIDAVYVDSEIELKQYFQK